MPTLIALRQLVGEWGNANANETFSTDEESALSLESRGLAVRWKPPKVNLPPGGESLESPENRMLTVPETKAEEPKLSNVDETIRGRRWKR
jgi:hypothetical protein